MSDRAIRDSVGSWPVPDLGPPAWTPPPRLADATVAVVSTAAPHHPETPNFERGDTQFTVLDNARRDIRMGHWSPNFDRSGFALDLNVVLPLDRLAERAAAGGIGALAPRSLSFAGNQDETMSAIRLDSGPAAAALLKADGVDVVLLTPV